MQLSYHLLSNKAFLAPSGLELRNQVYQMWKHYWERIYAEQGSDHAPKTEDFIRHDLFSILTVDGGKVIGFSAHTFLDFGDQSTYDRDFFQMFGTSYSDVLQSKGIHRVMTFESLIVRPEMKHNPWNLPLSRLLMRLNTYLLAETSAEAIMAVARRDNGVSQNSTMNRYELVEANKNCRGFPCDLQFLRNTGQVEELNDKTEPSAGRLWAARTLHFGESFITLKKAIKKAA